MTIQECYAALEGDYEEVLNRLYSEALVRKFLLKFLSDPSFQLLETSMQTGQHEEAFRAAHTLKGVSQNLSFTKLYASSNQLTEALRSGWSQEAAGLVEQVKQDYEQTVAAIRELQKETGA